MREIKFRCWYDNHMFDVTDIDFAYKMINLTGADIIKFTDGILMQYTGLKDKNGKEIYEGDIVRVRYKGKEDIGKIIYEYNGFTIDVMNMKRPYGRVPLIERFTEVIGNIYDNPELLEV